MHLCTARASTGRNTRHEGRVDPNRAFDVVVVGGANIDYLVKGEELPKPGTTVTGQLFQEAPGGKGANQAVAIARLGGRAAVIASVGSDQRGARRAARPRVRGHERDCPPLDRADGS